LILVDDPTSDAAADGNASQCCTEFIIDAEDGVKLSCRPTRRKLQIIRFRAISYFMVALTWHIILYTAISTALYFSSLHSTTWFCPTTVYWLSYRSSFRVGGTAAAAPPPFRPGNPALCVSRHPILL